MSRLLKTNTIQIEEHLAELIVSIEGLSAREAIARTVKSFPEASAIGAAFGFISMTSALENPIFAFTANDKEFAAEMYRAIAAFTADIYAVESLYPSPSTCSQIIDFWLKSGDLFFAQFGMDEV